METGSVQLNHNGDCIEDTSTDQLLSSESSNVYNVFGDPELLPRVGDQYQVEIPEVITESEYLLYKKSPFELEFAPGFPSDFLMGLSIPILWINKEVEYTKLEGLESLYQPNKKPNKIGVLKSGTNKKSRICSQDEDPRLKFELTQPNGAGSGELKNLASEQETHQKYKGKEGSYLVPGSFSDLWSNIEEASFLLGLYIFGKNLRQVKKFVESKTMGDIQSFYYGKFYRSDKYRRWSDCRKMRSRKCVYGQRLFSGLRQQELLSRLFLHVSVECQNTLLEVSKTFGEGKMSLEEYVSTLKAIVGMSSLVEAVGIGTGKRDLTSITMEPLKSSSNHVVPLRPDIPIGKAYSSLAPMEIIKFLTGDFRLSKTRSNDLFWEAVWPRLLARGWHSEQPKDRGYYVSGSKRSLVFLMPGVKKFSRRRLVKGNHYFDSVSDVLSKVASDPSLLELDNPSNESNKNKEGYYGRSTETKYLQPRTPNRSTDLMKFTVVDTSLASGNTLKVREMRTLPDEVSSMSIISKSRSEESVEDSSKVSSEEDSDCVDNTQLFDQEDTNYSKPKKTVSSIGMFSDEKHVKIDASKGRMKDPDSGTSSVKNPKVFNNFFECKQPKKSLKCSSRGLKEDDLNYLAPVAKRCRRISICTHVEKQICCSETTDSSENNRSGMGSYQKRVSSTSSSKGSPIESSEGILCDTTFGSESLDEPLPRPLIDLNLPQVPPDFEMAEEVFMGLRERQENEANKSGNSTAPKSSPADAVFSENQPNMNSRRQSTRNRPLTTRALEALESGFLTTSRRRKNKEACPREKIMTENFGPVTVASQMGKVGNVVGNDDNDMFRKFQVLSEGNDAQIKGHGISIMGSFKL